MAVYRVTIVTLALQISACVVLFWMAWHELPEYQDALIMLGGSVLTSLAHLGSKKSFFNREEADFGIYGKTGVMHPLGTNIFWWCFYHFMELVLLLPALKICVQEIWL
jgi:hypothetical protein